MPHDQLLSMSLGDRIEASHNYRSASSYPRQLGWRDLQWNGRKTTDESIASDAEVFAVNYDCNKNWIVETRHMFRNTLLCCRCCNRSCLWHNTSNLSCNLHCSACLKQVEWFGVVETTLTTAVAVCNIWYIDIYYMIWFLCLLCIPCGLCDHQTQVGDTIATNIACTYWVMELAPTNQWLDKSSRHCLPMCGGCGKTVTRNLSGLNWMLFHVVRMRLMIRWLNV